MNTAKTSIEQILSSGFKKEFIIFGEKLFYPEHITKYFGWKKIESNLDIEYTWSNNFNRIWWDKQENNCTYLNNEKKRTYRGLPIITLNDFIRDCQRAGIKLLFTQEAINDLKTIK